MILVVENQSFPSIDYIRKLKENKDIRIEKYEHFQKMSFRNRYVIATANGITGLTIPVKGGREQKTIITEVEIDNSTNWRTKHWRSILSAYNKAPFFDFYASKVNSWLFNKEQSLFDFNIYILKEVCNLLQINSSISFTDEYKATYENQFDFRNVLLPKSFQDGRLLWQPKYSQVFEDRIGFQPNMSIIDLLFCEGPNAANLLHVTSPSS